MDNIRLQHRIEDLEFALKSVKYHIEKSARLDQRGNTVLSFEDGFNHAMKLVNATVETFINPQLNNNEKH